MKQKNELKAKSLGIKEFNSFSEKNADFQSIMTAGFITNLASKTTNNGKKNIVIQTVFECEFVYL